MNDSRRPIAKGRGAQINPPNRFEALHQVDDFEQLADDDEHWERMRSIPTEYIIDSSQSIISENNSPDIPFRYSLNPYRGCAHGCAYCYARPTHEYLGLNAGLDFETKIFVKERAPELLREWLARDAYEPEVIVFSGVTDCYQPIEREYQLTRKCLLVAQAARQPISIITKNALVTREIDILSKMAKEGLASVAISVTTLEQELACTMEPRTSSPSARLRSIQELTSAGVPTSVMLAPIIPGLNESEIPAILEAAADAGAKSASYILLRLPLNVKPVFLDWLERTQPTKLERVQSRIRSTRGGKLSDAKFGRRMRGTGEMAIQIEQTFRLFAKRFELHGRLPRLDVSQFEPPLPKSGQMRLF